MKYQTFVDEIINRLKYMTSKNLDESLEFNVAFILEELEEIYQDIETILSELYDKMEKEDEVEDYA